MALGPYIGDFEHEVLTFIPYMKWISSVLNPPEIYVSTHFNRSFFYSWIPHDNIYPVYEEFSRNELQQNKYIHENVSLSDYMLILKQFKNNIQSKHPDKEVDNYYLNYSKSSKIHYPIYKKEFKRIGIDKGKSDYIVFIPDNRYCADELQQIYDELIKEHNVIIVGDMKTHLVDDNVVLQYPDYVENGYKYIMKYIISAKAVICPASHWSALANIEQVPLFTWGPQVTQFKEGGIYNFGNKCLAIPADEEIEIEKIVSAFNYFIESIGDE